MPEVLVSLDCISPLLSYLVGVGEINASWVAWSWCIVMDVFNIILECLFISLIDFSCLRFPSLNFLFKLSSCFLSCLSVLSKISNDLVCKSNIHLCSIMDFVSYSSHFICLSISNKRSWLFSLNLSSSWCLKLLNNSSN